MEAILATRSPEAGDGELPRGQFRRRRCDGLWLDTRTRGKAVWCIRYRGLDGKWHRERTKARTRDEALTILHARRAKVIKAEILEAPNLAAIERVTVREFVEKFYRPGIRTRKTVSSRARDESSLLHLLPVFGGLPLRIVTAGLVQQYGQQRREAGAKPSTVNREIATLSAIFREAFKLEYLDVNVVRRVSKYREDNLVIRWLNDEEEKRLLAACPQWLQPIVRLAIHTGLRKGELLGLTWADVDLENGCLRVRATKTGKTRYVPLNPIARETLEAAHRERSLKTMYVFFNPDTGDPWFDLKPVWYRDVVPKLEDQGIPHVRFHDLRHTFASRLVQRGVPLNTVRELLGHGTMAMTLRYAHLAPNNLQAAVDALTEVPPAVQGSVQGSYKADQPDSRRARKSLAVNGGQDRD